MTKHYIRLDGIYVIKSFSTDFEQPLKTDICVNEDGSRHFSLDTHNMQCLPNYKYVDGEILSTTEKDLQPLKDKMKADLPSATDQQAITVGQFDRMKREQKDALLLQLLNKQGLIKQK